jgi:hypothetical protein
LHAMRHSMNLRLIRRLNNHLFNIGAQYAKYTSD